MKGIFVSRQLLHILVLLASSLCAVADDRPNVVLFIADDVSWNDVGCYGNEAARTPNIDKLAINGIRFDRAFLTASSCSPSRSSIITGRYPHNNGKASELHQPISEHLPWFPELLRDAGYYTALSGKHHMKSTSERHPAFDHVDGGRSKSNSGGHANWVDVTRRRPLDKPFFFWFAAFDAHRNWEADQQWDERRYGSMHQPENVVVPPFLIDDLATRQDLASYYNEITRFDHYIGRVVAELQNQNELDNTLILVMADNGRPFPRAKTRLHDSGMRTALVAHWPIGITRKGTADCLVSAIDLAPTILQMAGCSIPPTVQGISMLPLLTGAQKSIRDYAFSEHNWHDYEAHGRSVRHGDFLLVRNFRPQLPWQGPADSVRSPSHQSLLSSRNNGELNAVQQDIFLAPRPDIELYNMASDPWQLTNLAGDTDYSSVRVKLNATLEQWMDQTGDSVPASIRRDMFDREKGTKLQEPDFITADIIAAGEDRNADQVNAPGPR
jgi:N-sulfoglucosamine sulfohydrolase